MIIDLGTTDYEEAYKVQRRMVAMRALGEIDDSLISVEHNPIFTIGRTGRMDNLIATGRQMQEKGVRLVGADRGGDITFHGPGQAVLYPILDLRMRHRDLHRYMRDLESVAIDFLAGYGLKAERVGGLTGVWAGGRKIASIGVGARNWVTFHGLAVNIGVDLSYFSMIRPCGMRGVGMTSLNEMLGMHVDMGVAVGSLIASAKRVLRVSGAICRGVFPGAIA